MNVEPTIFIHPGRPRSRGIQTLSETVSALLDCQGACLACADASLSERELPILRSMIRVDHDCAVICAATSAVLARWGGVDPRLVRAQLESALIACGVCAAECELHLHLEHCRICGQTCRIAEQWCRRLLAEI